MIMETYVTVAFWLGLVATIIRGSIMSTSKYPRIEEKTLGSDIFMMMIQIGFMAWCAVLLWIV